MIKILVFVLLVSLIVLIVTIITITTRTPAPPDYFSSFLQPEKEWSLLDKRFQKRTEIIQPTIFVAIASYRDPMLVPTLTEMFDFAHQPHRVFVGVVEQNDQGDAEGCHVDSFQSSFYQQVRVIRIDYTEAKGPTHARSLCEQLYQDEDYYLLLDSHMKFERGWDSELIDMLLRCPRPHRTIITCYPAGWVMNPSKKEKIDYTVAKRKGFRYQYLKKLNENGIIQFASVSTHQKPPDVPPLTAFYAAGFAFSVGEFVKQIPYPDNTPFLFIGEEMLMGMRAFTHGWDLRLPRFSVVYHHYKRDYRKTVYYDKAIQKKSIQHAIGVMQGTINDERHELGTVRSRDEYFEYVGISGVGPGATVTRSSKPWSAPPNYKSI